MIKYIDNQEVIMIKAGHWEVLMQTLIQTFMDRRRDLLTALWQQCFADHSVAGTIGIADSASRYWHGARGDCASDLRVVANLSKYLFRDLGNRRVN